MFAVHTCEWLWEVKPWQLGVISLELFMILLLIFQASLITEYAGVVQPIQLAFQQQIQALKTQHEKFVTSLKQQQQACPAGPAAPPAEAEKAPPITTQASKRISPTNCLSVCSVLMLKKGI